MTKPHYRATAGGPVQIGDGLVNFNTGLGVVGQAKAASATYQFRPTSQRILDAAYRASWLAKACINLPVDDAIGPGRNWQGDADQINKIEEEEKRLRWKKTLKRAAKMADKDGGAAILIDIGDDASLPLDVTTIRPGQIRKLIAFARRELTWTEIEDDISSPDYGRPKMWRLAGSARLVNIHPSRMVVIPGEETLEGAFGRQAVWSDSRLESRLNAIRDAESACSNAAEMLYEANVDVIGIKGLMAAMASGNEQGVLERLRLMQQGKSISKTLVHDQEETFERKAISFGAVPDLLREALQVASAAVQIPATRFLGRSPAGLNSTGEGDEKVYFDRLDARREEIQEETERLDQAIVNSALGTWPEGLHYLWPPLKQVSDKEKAEIFKMLAEGMATFDGLGILTLDERRSTYSNAVIEAGSLPGLEAAMLETEQSGVDPFDFGAGEEDDEPPATGGREERDPDAPGGQPTGGRSRPSRGRSGAPGGSE